MDEGHERPLTNPGPMEVKEGKAAFRETSLPGDEYATMTGMAMQKSMRVSGFRWDDGFFCQLYPDDLMFIQVHLGLRRCGRSCG